MLDFWIYSSFFSLYQSSSAVLFFGQEHIRSVLLQDFFDGKLVGQAYLTFCIYLFFFWSYLNLRLAGLFFFSLFIILFPPPGVLATLFLLPFFILAYFVS